MHLASLMKCLLDHGQDQPWSWRFWLGSGEAGWGAGMGALPGSSPLLTHSITWIESLSCLENEKVRQGLSKPSSRFKSSHSYGIKILLNLWNLKDRELKKKKKPDSRQAKFKETKKIIVINKKNQEKAERRIRMKGTDFLPIKTHNTVTIIITMWFYCENRQASMGQNEKPNIDLKSHET